MNKDNNIRYFSVLTGVRTVAASMVCLFHFNPFTEAFFGSGIHDFFNEFHVGVTFFFVLSGFLIAYRYYHIPVIPFKEYMIKRFARLYPVYFLITTLVLGMNVFHGVYTSFGAGLLEYFFNITFLKGLFDEYKFTGILQGWSLTVEEMFYLLAPISFSLIKRNRLSLVLLPLFYLLLGYGLIALFGQYDKLFGFFQNAEFMLSYTFLGRAFEFFTGIGLALIFLTKQKASGPVRGYKYTLLGMLNCILCIYAIPAFKGNDLYGIRSIEGKWINNFFLSLMGIAVLYWGLLTERNWLSSLLSHKWIVILGKSSYSFYLIHLLVSNINSNFLFVLIVSFVLSIFIFNFIEEPVNNYLRKKLL